ncbi:MAG: fimbrillin family protein [Rikenellaceae bacterium]
MKKIILASLAVAATLASCEKTSEIDTAITSTQTAMKFTTYASGATTKGDPVDSNTEFKGTDNSFMVSAYFTATAEGNTGKYFAFSEVAYDYTGGAWANQSDMYWPNEDGNLYFGAYYPGDATFTTTPTYVYGDDHSLGFGYTVGATVADHEDIMYAIKTLEYDGTEDAVNLHFKHALTQVGFTATADSDISVTVSSITVCNVMNGGTFSATKVTDDSEDEDETVAAASVDTDNFGGWTVGETFANYAVAMAFEEGESAITVGSTATTLTDADDALMLIPQALTAWVPGTDGSGTESYLAIKCTIKHAAPIADADVTYASIIDGYVFVPFSTADIKYEDTNTTDGQWNPGYKITYNLHFGGGYTIPGFDPDDEDGEDDLPEPGETPDDIDDDVIETLRAITYTISVDEWIPASGGTVSFGTTEEA